MTQRCELCGHRIETGQEYVALLVRVAEPDGTSEVTREMLTHATCLISDRQGPPS